jgi:hypothetical protein
LNKNIYATTIWLAVVLFADHAKRLVNLMAFVLAFSQMALATPPMTMYVATNTPALGDGTNNWANATNSIQGAIDAISNSPASIVWVSNGVYVLPNQVTVAKAINICGYPNGSLPVIDGNNSNRCLYITANCVLSNLFITRGNTNGNGGGVYFTTGGNVYNCVFSNNYATNGGGMYGGTQILDCAFIANTATNSSGGSGSTFYGGGCGGGLYTGNARVANCTFLTNIASGYYDVDNGVIDGGGGGMFLSTFISVTNCQFIGNVALCGGGLAALGNGFITTCTIVSNIAGYGGVNGVGGGVGISQYASCILSNSFISNNISTYVGGGIFASKGYVKNCRIARNIATGNTTSGNYAGGGGGVALAQSYIQNCIIEENIASTNGSGKANGGGIIFNTPPALGTVQNCLIRNNSAAGYGGGIGFGSGGSGGIIDSCTIVSNYADTYYGGGISSIGNGLSVYFENTIAYNNKDGSGGASSNFYSHIDYAGTVIYLTNCCVAPVPSASYIYPANCIASNPNFVNSAGDDYRLQNGSSCINAGVNRSWMTIDLDGHSRLDHYSRIVDMGCYEYLPAGSMYRLGF